MPSVFVRHPQSGPLEVAPDIRERLSEAVHHLDSGGRLEDLIQITRTPAWWGIDARSTWARLLQETCERLSRPEEGATERVGVLLSTLRAALAAEAGADTWAAATKVLLDNVDVISSWEHSSTYRWHRDEPVWRAQGQYFVEMQGETQQIIGRRTEIEERWDYIADAAEHSCRPLHLVIRLIALICIADTYMARPTDFPSSVEVAFYEQQAGTSFTAWKWQQKFPFYYRRTKWRPPNVLCDPEWLVYDFLASFSDREAIPQDEARSQIDPGLQARWLEEFAGFPGQFECAVDTNLQFGDVPEVWFQFRGRVLRWVNRTDQMEAVLIVPVLDRNNAQPEHRLALRFLSAIAFATGLPTTTQFAVAGTSSFHPMIRQPRRLGGMVYPQDFNPFAHGEDAEALDLPMALYREGLSSGSIYYSFLSFYKVVQLAFGERGGEIRTWVNGNLGRINELFEEWLEAEGVGPEEAADHLWNSGRCAIAHVTRQPIVDPDDPSDWLRISRSLPIVRGLARLAITSGLFGPVRWVGY